MDAATLVRHALEALKRPLTLKEALSSVADFRIDRKKKYPLYEILMVAVCAMIDGAKGPTDFERFGKAKSKFLKKFLPLQNGIPSHDTFGRVLGKIDPRRFNAALVEWLRSATDVTGDIISIDGKLLRRALTKDCRMPCIVSAHSSRTKLVIGQVKADEKSNETTAIPALLDLLYLKGAIVTIDAAGCQNFTGRCAIGCWLLEHFGRRPLRARREDLAENLAMLRHVVLNVLRLDKSVFGGISVKRKELAWDDDKLLSLMLAA